MLGHLDDEPQPRTMRDLMTAVDKAYPPRLPKEEKPWPLEALLCVAMLAGAMWGILAWEMLT